MQHSSGSSSSDPGALATAPIRSMPIDTVYSRVPQRRDLEMLRAKAEAASCWRYVMRAILSVRPKCSHRYFSLKETPLKPVLILKHATRISTSMRTKWFKHTAMQIVQEHRLTRNYSNIHFWTCFSFTILFKIITRMKLVFPNYLGDYSYSYQGSSELISITVPVSLFFLAECSCSK